MPLFARIVPESDLIQIDREFDFRVPPSLQNEIAVGQRVTFNLGRSKKSLTGFVRELLEESPYATSDLISIVSADVVLSDEIYEFARTVANRQVVALGEILAQAIPEHMPKIQIPERDSQGLLEDVAAPPILSLSGSLAQRSSVLCSPRNVEVDGRFIPEWAIQSIASAVDKLKKGKSSILVLPEKDDVQVLMGLVSQIGVSRWVIDYTSSKKSERFKNFHQVLRSGPAIVIGTRSAIYAPAQELALIAVVDDLDDSLREEGSPFTNARDLALIRAGNAIDLLFLANYRSVELQRLVEIDFLKSVESLAAPVRFSYSEPGQRIDAASFALLREQLETGPLLVLVPRKGHSLATFCNACREKVRCKNCAGAIWQSSKGVYECRLCSNRASSCHNCNSIVFESGRAGSERTVAELGKAFPNTVITEVTAEKPISKLKSNNQIVVATPGSVPAGLNGFAGVLIVDSDIWLSRETLRSEELAIRDWMDALSLMHPAGRAVAAGMPAQFGKLIALGQHINWAKSHLSESRALKLPPSVRTVSIDGKVEIVETTVSDLIGLGAEIIRFRQSETNANALLRFQYKLGPEISSVIRNAAIKAAPRTTSGGNRRGLRVVMDDVEAL